MLQLKPLAVPNRNASLFARVQKTNKTWATTTAKARGFKTTADFIDQMMTEVRLETAKKTARSTTKRAKTTTRPSRKKATKK